MSMILDGSNGVTFNDASLQGAAASPNVLKNRIINGAMVIDQRFAGAATANTINDYTVDRWQVLQSVTGKLIAQQNAAAVTPPTGFTNYLGVTSQSSYSVLTGDYYIIRQSIEGYNVADLGFGTANAKTITLSFWVRSSLTGTFGGALQNSGSARSYPFSYTISSANTWEQKTITIAGDTSGTWLTTNGVGLLAQFGLGVGSTFSGTAGAWASANYVSATGATSVVGTNGATFYITGVQLEQNTSATPFERRLFNQELANCQRYFEMSYDIGTVPGTASVLGSGSMTNITSGLAGSTAGDVGGGSQLMPFKVTKRTNPTVVAYDFDGTANAIRVYPANAKKTGVTALAVIRMDGSYQFMSFNSSSATAIPTSSNIVFGWTASAEL